MACSSPQLDSKVITLSLLKTLSTLDFQRYVFESENKLVAGDHINWSKPLDRGSSTLRHLLVAKVSPFSVIIC